LDVKTIVDGNMELSGLMLESLAVFFLL